MQEASHHQNTKRTRDSQESEVFIQLLYMLAFFILFDYGHLQLKVKDGTTFFLTSIKFVVIKVNKLLKVVINVIRLLLKGVNPPSLLS